MIDGFNGLQGDGYGCRAVRRLGADPQSFACETFKSPVRHFLSLPACPIAPVGGAKTSDSMPAESAPETPPPSWAAADRLMYLYAYRDSLPLGKQESMARLPFIRWCDFRCVGRAVSGRYSQLKPDIQDGLVVRWITVAQAANAAQAPVRCCPSRAVLHVRNPLLHRFIT